ncbi:hypothetical protein HMPREF0645_1523, partial [Hallella bergensis DSM 17361]
MSEELDNKNQEPRQEQNQGNEQSREGYGHTSEYQNDYREGNVRSQRPRIHT